MFLWIFKLFARVFWYRPPESRKHYRIFIASTIDAELSHWDMHDKGDTYESSEWLEYQK